jgi:hypothetical protein
MMFLYEIQFKKMAACTCNNLDLTVEITCAKCNSDWNRKMDQKERINSCPQHYRSVAICSYGYELCDDCQKDGFYVINFGFGPPEIKKKVCSCHSTELTKERDCANCHFRWTSNMSYDERVGTCFYHHGMIVRGAPSYDFCSTCKQSGYRYNYITGEIINS